MPRTKVKCGHKSFWWLNFKDQGISMQVLSATTGIDQERLEHFLTGQSMPPRNIAVKLCSQFDIPESKGFKEFRKAHKAWKIIHTEKQKTSKAETTTYIFELPKLLDGRSNNKGRPKKLVNPDIVELSDVLESIVSATIEATPTLVREVNDALNVLVAFDEDLKLIYGKVSYNTYMKFRKGEITLKDILPELYGKIDLDTYLKIYKS